MSYLEIEKVIGRGILDSRGNSTVEAEITLAGGTKDKCKLGANAILAVSIATASCGPVFLVFTAFSGISRQFYYFFRNKLALAS